MKPYEEKLKEAETLVGVAMIKVGEASNMIRNFDKSKPLNILYKELRAAHMLLAHYNGEKMPLLEGGFDIAIPQSIKAYLNLNTP